LGETLADMVEEALRADEREVKAELREIARRARGDKT
jgi:hypothetical protein